MEANALEQWRKVRQALVVWLAFGMLLGAVLAFWAWGFSGLVAMELAALCLALGFWLTEMLVGVFTQVKRANPTAIALLFLGKLSWWGILFWGAKHIPQGLDGAVAAGMGIFLLALLASSLQHFGMPSISDGKPPPDP